MNMTTRPVNFTMLLLFAVILSPSTELQAEGGPVPEVEFQVTEMRSFRKKSKVTLQTSKAPLEADIYHVRVAFPTSKEAITGGEVILIHAPTNGLSWWVFSYRLAHDSARLDKRDRLQSIRKTWSFFMDEGAITGFALPGTMLHVFENGGRHHAPEDALADILRALQARRRDLQSGAFETPGHSSEIDMRKFLGVDFFMTMRQSGRTEGAITDLTFEQGRWRISVGGVNSETAVVYLNRNLTVHNAIRNGKSISLPK